MAKASTAEPRNFEQRTTDECLAAVAALDDSLTEVGVCALMYPPALAKKPCFVATFRNGTFFRMVASHVPLKQAQKICRQYNRQAKGGPFVAAFIPQVEKGD